MLNSTIACCIKMHYIMHTLHALYNHDLKILNDSSFFNDSWHQLGNPSTFPIENVKLRVELERKAVLSYTFPFIACTGKLRERSKLNLSVLKQTVGPFTVMSKAGSLSINPLTSSVVTRSWSFCSKF